MKGTVTFRTTIFTVAMLVAVQLTVAQRTEYGKTSFPTSGAPEAQGAFLKGLLMLHSFEYEDAREAFQEAQRIDPGFAMAYWGEAMTHNHPIWMEQDREAARAALAKLAPTSAGRLAKAATEREKDYLRAIDVLFGEGDKNERDFAYAEAMGRLAAKYPDDLDAATFHALALLGTCHDGRDFSIYMKAAAIVEEVFAKNPQHPGAAHYLIHSYDDPIHAPLGLRPARVYAKIAPAASHALHMPSHIFFAMGMWDEAAKSNEDSYAAAKAWAERKHVPLGGHGYHAIWWLLYSYLQQGKYAEARKQLDIVEENFKQNHSSMARSHLVRMRASYLIETQNWNSDALRVKLEASEMSLGTAAIDLFVNGLAALKAGNRAAAERALEDIKARRALSPKESAEYKNGAEIFELELEALLKLDDGKSEAAIELMTNATHVEDAMPLDFGPPWPTKPSHELFGEILLNLNRPADAMQQFKLALKRAPRRATSLLGLARAASRANETKTAQQAYADLNIMWQHADSELPALQEVKKMLEDASPGSK
jgi:tetratricopeptide (TPR) repeat protein